MGAELALHAVQTTRCALRGVAGIDRGGRALRYRLIGERGRTGGAHRRCRCRDLGRRAALILLPHLSGNMTGVGRLSIEKARSIQALRKTVGKGSLGSRSCCRIAARGAAPCKHGFKTSPKA